MYKPYKAIIHIDKEHIIRDRHGNLVYRAYNQDNQKFTIPIKYANTHFKEVKH